MKPTYFVPGKHPATCQSRAKPGVCALNILENVCDWVGAAKGIPEFFSVNRSRELLIHLVADRLGRSSCAVMIQGVVFPMLPD